MESSLQRTGPASKNLLRVVFALPGGIFMAEVIAMLLILLYEGPYFITILIDAVITTTLMLPLIYFFSYRPLLNHLAERQQSENIMRVRLRLMQFAVDHTVDELLQTTLDEIEALTGSTVGFFHLLDAGQKEISLQFWSSNTLQSMCAIRKKDNHCYVEQAGVWAECIGGRQPVVHNNYEALPNRKGLPEGHAPMIREMTVPILRHEKVVAILGVGNKPREYTANDVELVSTLADFAWDIIERKQAEVALKESEEKFRTLVNWTYNWEHWVNPQGNLVYISPSCERISGFLPEEFISQTGLLVDIVHPDDRKIYREHNRLIHDASAGVSNVEHRVVARDGTIRWIDHICRPLFGNDGEYLGRRVSNRDITEYKRAQQEIMDRNQREYMLTKTIHTLQIEMARDLHDTVGQNIGYLRMKLDHLSESNIHDREDVKTEIKRMLQVANESYELVRGTLAVLQSGGLVEPLTLFRQYADQVAERSPFTIVLSSKGEPSALTPNQARQLFFVFREALSNIEKHAQASEVCVEFFWARKDLALTIADNGTGFSVDDMKTSNRYGLKFMRERIELLKGVFSIQSSTNLGTRINIKLPLKKNESRTLIRNIENLQ